MTADIAERARFVRAAARYQLRLYPDAHADLQTIMGDNPQNVNAQVLDALTLQHMGRPKEALNRLNLIVEAHPHHIDAISTARQWRLNSTLRLWHVLTMTRS